jgi:hypothetical protein
MSFGVHGAVIVIRFMTISLIEVKKNMTEKEKTPLEKQREKTLKLLDTDEIENKSHEAIPEEELEEASEDIPKDEFTEEHEGSIAPLSKSGSSEISTDKDERFSKSHEIDEETLRKNKQKQAESGGGAGQ